MGDDSEIKVEEFTRKNGSRGFCSANDDVEVIDTTKANGYTVVVQGDVTVKENTSGYITGGTNLNLNAEESDEIIDKPKQDVLLAGDNEGVFITAADVLNDENISPKEQVMTLRAKRDTEVIKGLGRNINDLTFKINDLVNENSRLKEQLESQTTDSISVEVHKQIEGLKKELSDKEAYINKIAAQADKECIELKELRTRSSDNPANNNLERTNTHLHYRIGKLQDEITELKQSVNFDALKEVEVLKSENEDKESTIQKYLNQIEELKQSVNFDALDLVDTLGSEVEEQGKITKELEINNHNLTKELEAKNTKIYNQKLLLEKSASKIKELAIKSQDYLTDNNDLNKEAEGFRQSIKAHEKIEINAASRITELTNRLRNASHEMENRDEWIKELRGKAEIQDEQLKIHTNNISNYLKHIDELKGKINVRNKALLEYQGYASVMEHRVFLMVGRIKELTDVK